MTYKKFAINNYVVFRIKDEWQECRIKDILPGEHKESRNFILHILKYNVTHAEPIPDTFVHASSLENQKKFRFTYKYNESQFPLFLIHFLKEDKIKMRNNMVVAVPTKTPVQKIVADFVNFFSANKPSIMADELEEVENGFCYSFNVALRKYLIYDREIEHLEKVMSDNKNSKPSEIYGIEHFVRLLYFMMCRDRNEDDVIFEYVYYICDFLDLHYKKYFLDRNYEDLK